MHLTKKRVFFPTLGIYHIGGLAKNSQTLTSLTINKYRFFDSCLHLSRSLGSLLSQLKSDKTYTWPIVSQSALVKTKNGGVDPEKLDLLTSKILYPYHYNTSVSRMHATKEYPPISAFQNTDGLSKEKVTEEIYNKGKRAFQVFECKSLYEFCLVYMHADTLGLASVWSKYRAVSRYMFDFIFLLDLFFSLNFFFCQNMHSNFGLDPTAYLTFPSLTFVSR